MFISNNITILESIPRNFASDDSFVDLFSHVDDDDKPPVIPRASALEEEVHLPQWNMPSPASSPPPSHRVPQQAQNQSELSKLPQRNPHRAARDCRPPHFNSFKMWGNLASEQSHWVETTNCVNDQISVKQALQETCWCAAMQEEFDSLIANLT
jgi:hypothetical protein